MFYFGRSTNQQFQIGYAYSNEGISWTKYSSNPVLQLGPGTWENLSLSQSWVIYKDNQFKMWYAGCGTDQIFQIGYATSPPTPTAVYEQPGVPDKNALYPNYPNPFNPETKLEYDVGSNELVTIKVYNTLGEEVATLLNEQKRPGRYSAYWNAKSASSGTYWARMTANNKAVVQKMIFVK